MRWNRQRFGAAPGRHGRAQAAVALLWSPRAAVRKWEGAMSHRQPDSLCHCRDNKAIEAMLRACIHAARLSSNRLRV